MPRATALRSPRRAALAQALVWLLIAPTAWSGPSGGEVVEGSAVITSQGQHTTIHAADRTIVEWQDFDIAVDESVRFVQPNAMARVLNRVVTPDPTQIDGTLRANGRVYILNPYGVYFGETAIVDVGQLIAAAGNLSNADFLAGVDRFTELGGRVENLGEIRAGVPSQLAPTRLRVRNDRWIGATARRTVAFKRTRRARLGPQRSTSPEHGVSVGLFGASVANHGLISAPDGAIWLVAGDEVLVAQHDSPIVVRIAVPDSPAPEGYGADNTGRIEAERGSVRMAAGDLLSLAVRNQGTIRAADIELAGGEEGRVQVEGTLDATHETGVGGQIEVRGDFVALEGATVDASGATGGGRVHLGGGWQGERGAGERNARLTFVDDQSVVRADALDSGDGGDVVVWSDELAIVHGDLSARGGAAGGDGGRIETSGKRWIDLRTAPDASADNGQGGLWLLDPSNIEIDLAANSPGGEQDLSDLVAATTTLTLSRISPTVDNSFVAVEEIAKALARGVTVFLSTQNATGNNDQDGNIEFNAPLDFTGVPIRSGTRALLALAAANNITSTVGFTDTTDDPMDPTPLDLSLSFLAGDTSQPASPNPSESDERKIVEITGDIDIGGTLGFFGDEIKVTGSIKANRSEAESTGFAVALQANKNGIRTGAITTPTGHISLVSNNDDVTNLDANIVVDGTISSPEGGVEVRAIGGDIRLEEIDVCADCLLPQSVGAELPPVIDIDSVALFAPADPDDMGAMDQVAGGSVTLAGNIGGMTPSTGTIDVQAHQIDVQAAIDTAGGDVLLRTLEIDEVASAPLGVTTSGVLTTMGGDVVISGAGSVTVGADIDAATEDLTSQSSVTITGTDEVMIDNVAIQADERVSIQSGIGGTGNLTFTADPGTLPSIAADIVELGAGNGYGVDTTPGDMTLARIAFGNLRIQGAGDETETLGEFTILQDASIGSGDLPDSADVNLAAGSKLSIGSLDGSFEVDAAAAALVSEVDSARLDAARSDPVVPPEVELQALILGAPLSVDKLQVIIAEDFAVDASFADNVSGVRTLSVTTGTQAQTEGETSAVAGGLAIGSNLTGFDDLSLHAGAAGIGDLTVAADLSLSANTLALRAGDGAGGAAANARVDLGSGTLAADDFTLRQDAAIGGDGLTTMIPSVTELTQGAPTPARYRLQSDDASITIQEADRIKLEDRSLVLAANSFSTPFFDPADPLSSPLRVESLDIGGIGGLTVNNALLGAFDLTSATGPRELTVRAGIGLNGNLNITNGTVFEGDTIRLVASDGPGGTIGNVIVGANGADVRYRKPDSPEAPDTFIFEQDATLVQSALPTVANFDADLPLPATLGIRSHTDLQLTDLTTLPLDAGMGKLVLGGRIVSVINNTGVTFANETEIRSDSIALLAIEGAVVTVDPMDQAIPIRYAAHSTGEDEIDAGDFDPLGTAEGVPVLVEVQQDASLTGDNLASDPFGSRIDDAEIKTRYLLETLGGGISLGPGDLAKVRGTDLTLTVSSDDGTIGLSTSAGAPFELERLLIDYPRGLTFGNASESENALEVVAEDLILIEVGTDGEANQDLSFAGPTKLSANRITLRAGEQRGALLSELDADDLAVIDPRNLTIELTGESARLALTQDGSFEKTQYEENGPFENALPTISCPTVPCAKTVEFAEIHSRRGNLTLPEADLDLAANLLLRAGSVRQDDETGTPFGGELTLNLVGSETLEDALPDVEILTLAARNIELSAAADGQVLARGGPQLAVQFTSPDGSATSLESVTFEQDGAFALPPDTDTDPGQLVQASQFLGVDRASVEYVLRSRETGSFIVNRALADQLAIFNLTLETGDPNGVIEITAETPGPDGTTAALTPSPVFTGLTAIAPNIQIDTPRFDTVLSQRYQGTTTLEQPDITLSSLLDVVFEGAVDGATADTSSLTVELGRVAQFTEDVGATGKLIDLTVRFASGSGVLEFGASDDAAASMTASKVLLAGDLTVQSIDPVDFATNRTATVLDVRNPAPNVASIRKRGGGTLDIDAENVRVGAGQKWTTVGTLDIDAAGVVEVGDLTANRVEINADSLVVQRRARSNVLHSDGSSDSDAGVDWVANKFVLHIPNGVTVAGSGPNPVVGTPDGSRITNLDTGETLPFSSAEIFPDGRHLNSGDLLFTPDPGNPEVQAVLDMRPSGSPSSDFSRVLTAPVPAPSTPAPTEGEPASELVFRDVGIEGRALSGRESAGRERGAGIMDDASESWSGGWGGPSRIVHVAAPRLDAERTSEASVLFDQLFGAEMERADQIRTTLGRAVADYREHTGAQRVLGFELRRFLRNRPSTQFEAHQLLEQLDRLFLEHRHSGLVRGEYRPIQRAWVAAIVPLGIDAGELSQAIHPSRYVRGSDVLDVFGE